MSEQQIAPHEGREVELVLNGTKQLGSATLGSPTALVVRETNELFEYIKDDSVYFALTQEPIETYKFLNSSAAKVVIRSKQEHQRLLGRLFGYTEEEIDTFIEANLNCACGNCTGGF